MQEFLSNFFKVFERVCIPSLITNLNNTKVNSAINDSLDTL